MKKINNIFNTANKSLFVIGDTSRRFTPDSSGQRRILLSSCRGPISPLARGVPARAGCRKFGVRFAALVALFVATPSFATPTELDKKTVASKAYVDTKQDIIETGLVSVGDDWLENLPSVVSFDSTSGLVGNKYGILDLNVSTDYLDSGWSAYVGEPEVEYLIPTVGAVGRELQNLFNYLDWSLLLWSVNINGTPDNGATQTAAINAYNTTFGNGTNNWAGSGIDLINGQFLANSLALKQNKIAKSGYYYNTSGTVTAYGNSSATNGWLHAGVKGTGLVTKTATEGVVGERKIFEASDVANYHADGMSQNAQNIQDISIPTVGAVMSIVNTNAPTGTPGNVAMYDATTGALGDGVATYDGSTTYNASTDADKIAVMSGVQRKKECGGYEPAPAGQPAHDGTHPGDEDYCWLWIFPD